MPIRPIDLQTLFMQLSQVSRDQAVEKGGALLQQAMKSAADQKRLGEAKEAIEELEKPERPEAPGAGPEALRERGGRAPGGGGERREGAEAEGRGEAEEEIVRDPELGRRVDLSG